MVKHKNILVLAIVFCLTAVLLGAFAAHGLKAIVKESSVASFLTGVRYQMYHGLAMIVILLLGDRLSIRVGTILKLMALGIVFFSLSIYLLVLNNIWGITALKMLGPITPIGGLILIIAWTMLLLNVIHSNK